MNEEIPMVDPKKIQSVVTHLENEFPGCTVEGHHDLAQRVHRFVIKNGATAYRAIVLEEFLETHKAEEIPPLLTMFTLAEHLRELPSAGFVVTKRGLKLEHE